MLTEPSEGSVLDPLEALRGECEAVSETVLALAEEDFARPTRLPAWSVKQLLGHMYRDVDRTNVGLSEPAPEAADTDSVSYWRSYDPTADAPDIADRAKQIAANYQTGSELAQAWDEMWRRALDTASATDRARIIHTWRPNMTLDEFLRTRVLEITVHRLDLEHALGRRAWGSDAAVSIIDGILVGLLGKEPPSTLEWDVIEFIEKGTGRIPLTDQERTVLGRLANRFPLLA
jgi:uncharacterized protein (TIGR03083 family)